MIVFCLGYAFLRICIFGYFVFILEYYKMKNKSKQENKPTSYCSAATPFNNLHIPCNSNKEKKRYLVTDKKRNKKFIMTKDELLKYCKENDINF